MRAEEDVGYGFLIPLGGAEAVSEVRQVEPSPLSSHPHLDREMVRRGESSG